MSNKLLTVFNGATVNPLASVPWVAQWKFNNDGNDSIGSNTLTNNNSATFTDGKLGGAQGATALAAASSQSWNIASNANLQTGNVDFMVCLWVYPTAGGNMTFVSKGVNGSIFEWYIDTSGSGTSFTITGYTAGASGPVITQNNWHLIVAWQDRTLQTVNINIDHGTTVTSNAGSNFSTAGAGNFRVSGIGSSTTYTGRIDCVGFAKGAGSVPTQAVLDALWNDGAGTENFT